MILDAVTELFETARRHDARGLHQLCMGSGGVITLVNARTYESECGPHAACVPGAAFSGGLANAQWNIIEAALLTAGADPKGRYEVRDEGRWYQLVPRKAP